MKSYEVKKISTILAHFYNLEKLKKTLVFSVSKTIVFLIIAVEPLRSCFLEKIAVFIASMAEGMCNWFLNRTGHCGSAPFQVLYAPAMGQFALCNLTFAVSFLFTKTKKTKNKKTRNKKKTQQTASDPLPLGCAILFFFFCFFWFLGVLLSWFVVILRDWQKKWQDLTLCHFSPLRHCKFVCGCFCLLQVSGSIRNHVKTKEKQVSLGEGQGLGAWIKQFCF